jgi:hypothetical protein
LARRLTLGELSDLVDEHDGVDGAIAARPDLADMLRAIEKAGRSVSLFPKTTPTQPLPLRGQTPLSAEAIVEAFKRSSGENTQPSSPGQKSRWHPATLETITKRLAAGDSARAIGPDVDIRHQRISELRARGDTYWDTEKRKLVTPEGTTRDARGFYVLPPVRK